MQVWQLFGTVDIKDQASSKLKGVQSKFKSTSDTVKSESGLMGSALGKFGKALVAAFAVEKMITFGKNTVETSAKIQALDSMFTQTFKESASKAMQGINMQAREQNINVDRLKGTWASFFGTFRGNGASVNESLNLTKKYMKLAGDGAAYYDMSLDEVVARMKSLVMGNFEAGDAIGININATKMDTKAKKQYKKAWKDLTDTQKEFLLIDTIGTIYKNSGAMGQGAREANNYENVVGNLKATWARFLGTIGSPILTVVVKVLQLLTTGVQGLVGWITQAIQPFQQWADSLKLSANQSGIMGRALSALKGIFNALKTLVVSVIGVLIKSFQQWYNNNQTTVNGIVKVITNCMKVIQEIIQNVTSIIMAIWSVFGQYILDFAITCFTFVLQRIEAILNIIGGVIKFFTSLFKGDWKGAWDAIKQIVKGVLVFIYQLIFNALLGKIFGVLKNFGSKILSFFTGNGTGLKNIAKEVWNFIYKHISTVVKKIAPVVKAAWNIIKTVTSSVFKGIKTIVMTIWNGIKTIIMTVVNAIGTIIKTVWNLIYKYTQNYWKLVGNVIKVVINVIKTIITTVFNFISKYIQTIWKGISVIIKTYLNIVKTVITVVFNAIKNIVSVVWNIIKTIIVTVWNVIKTTITTIINVIKTIITTVFNTIKSVISTIWNSIKTIITTIVNAIKNFISDRFNKTKGIISDILNAIKTIVSTVWNSIKTIISTVINVIKTIITTVWNGIKSLTSSVWNAIKTVITTSINAAKSVISSVVKTIKSVITNVWNGIKSVTVTVWNSIKEAIIKPVEKAKEKVKNLIEKIKGFFNFTWKLPPLKLPHLSISGGFSIMPPSVPKFGIEWYANGGILTKPTAFGVNPVTGNTMIGGEAGPEAVLPIEKLSGILSETLADIGYGNQPIIINIDGRKVFEAMSPHMAMACKGRR
ncbi:MAG: hypothetical protein E6902_13455 [Paeniclostridium sordellii]|nr:hypothetical protein [Paeniclostridium sordellii]